jgi:serine protease Do
MIQTKISIKIMTAFTGILLAAFVASVVTLSASPAMAANQSFLSELGNAMSQIADKVKPSVVNISTSKTIKTPRLQFSDPAMQRFFGNIKPQKQKVFSLGSGVIVSKDGYIVTCNHVIQGAEDILVKLHDNREFKGKIVGMDSKTDIAVIKITADNLPTVTWGDSAGLRTGGIVIAFGNPFGLSQTVTMGIVSATGRSGMGIVDYEDFIQTDASINPGNSGGALVNADGELVGINDAIFSTSGGNQGIGFAVPSNMVKNIMDSIINKGKVIRGYIGVQVQPLNAELAKQFKLKDDKGVLLNDVTESAPAEKAGLKRGDIIVSIDGKKTDDVFYLRNQVASTPPGGSVVLGVIRDGVPLSFKVTVSELASDNVSASTETADNALKGIVVQDLTKDIIKQLRLKKDTKGVVVGGIDEDSPATGIINRGDVIMEINRKPVKNTAEFRKLAAKIQKNESVMLLVSRAGFNRYITLGAQ